MSDRNLYFQMLNDNRQQRKLQRPLLRGNTPICYKESKYKEHQLSFGGADKNLFFQMQEKGKARLVPFMLKRQFKDLEPSSRIIGSLDTTKEERQATALVKGIQNISSLLNSFLSEPETDSSGNVVLDSEGNPKYKTKSMEDQLTVARDSIKLMLQEVQVPSNDLQNSLIDTFDVDDSKSILSTAENVISHGSWDEASQEEKSSLISDILINESLPEIKDGDDDPPSSKEDFEDEGDVVSGERGNWEIRVNLILQNTKFTGDPKTDDVPDIIEPEWWERATPAERNDVFRYLIVRRYKQGRQLRNFQGWDVPDRSVRRSLGQNLGRKNRRRLDVKNMIFI